MYTSGEANMQKMQQRKNKILMQPWNVAISHKHSYALMKSTLKRIISITTTKYEGQC